MGLLSRIAAGIDLNSTTEAVKVSSPLSFSQWTKKYSLSRVGIFQKKGIFYSFCASKGFDGESILQSLSTADFWEGTIQEGKWNIFSHEDNNLNTMLQFFSQKLKNEISYVAVYMINDYIILIAQNEKSDIFSSFNEENTKLEEISSDFLNINFESPWETCTELPEKGFQISINIEQAVSHISGNLSYNIKENIVNAFILETYNTIESLLLKPLFFKSEDKNKISFFIETESHISIEALKEFLFMNLKTLFKDFTDLIEYGTL